MINHVLNIFRQKPPHEQRIIILSGILSLIVLFWFGLYRPLDQTIDTLQSRCQKLRSDGEWLGKQVAAAGLLPEKRTAGKPADLINSSLKKAGLDATIQQVNAGDIEVNADDIKMENFMRWLDAIQIDHGLRITALEFHASKKSAENITLTRLVIEVKKNG
ncbi:type II secretion system protein GspM [unidentified bacterial endosymbiont]|uniref:type II secretion system protein GspM n=1 Tax=unidentified bacterial endosymbiont TaxID=2355 RepID=UPI00209F5159|nr:type II secretion system protein GspM [unidentified bacterial endosymbiont]